MTVLQGRLLPPAAPGSAVETLVYADTLLAYLPPPPSVLSDDPQWVGQDWEAALAPHYDTAEKMLGAVTEARSSWRPIKS
jgi:cholesterol oxidase